MFAVRQNNQKINTWRIQKCKAREINMDEFLIVCSHLASTEWTWCYLPIWCVANYILSIRFIIRILTYYLLSRIYDFHCVFFLTVPWVPSMPQTCTMDCCSLWQWDWMYTATPDNVLDIAAVFFDTEIIIVIKINVSYHRFKRFCTCRYLLKKIYMEHFCWRRPFVVCGRHWLNSLNFSKYTINQSLYCNPVTVNRSNRIACLFSKTVSRRLLRLTCWQIRERRCLVPTVLPFGPLPSCGQFAFCPVNRRRMIFKGLD